LNYEHPFPTVLGYQRVCDIMKVDITESRVHKRESDVTEVDVYLVTCGGLQEETAGNFSGPFHHHHPTVEAIFVNWVRSLRLARRWWLRSGHVTLWRGLVFIDVVEEGVLVICPSPHHYLQCVCGSQHSSI
jgi:hypothetical protein